MKSLVNECKIEIIRIFRNPYFVFWSLLMPLVFYVMFTKVFNQSVESKSLWDKHFLMSIAAFSVMGSAIMTLGIRMVQERSEGWTTFIKVTPLSNLAYVTAKMVGQSVVHIFSIIFIFIAGKLINGISMSLTEWITAGLWILFGSLPFLALGLLVGSMKKVDTASGISNLVYLLLAITGGMWMPMESMPKVIQVIGEWLPAYHYGNGAWQIIRGNTPELVNALLLLGYLGLLMYIALTVRKKQEAV